MADTFDPLAYSAQQSGEPQSAFDPLSYSQSVVEDPSKQVTTPPESIKDYAMRNYVNPLARAGAKAVWALPGMAMDVGVAARNAIESRDIHASGPYELPSTSFNRALDTAFPPPGTTYGKIGEAVNTGIVGGMMPGLAPTASTSVPSNFVSPNAAATSGLTGAQQKALQAGKDLGMRITPGQETGSTVLQQAEARASSIPALSGPFGTVAKNNSNVLGTVAARSIGESGSSVDSDVMGRAAERMGDIFDKAGNPNNVLMSDPKTTSTILDAIDTDKLGLLPGSGSVRDNPLVQKFEDLAKTGSMNGQQLAQISSKLGKAAYKQKTSAAGDRDLGDALYQVKSHADDLLQQTLSPEDQAEFAAARGQYHTLMQLTKPGVVNPSSGVVSGTTLANTLRSDRSGFLFGNNQSDLYNAARFSQAFKPTVGNSGTATRAESLKDLALAVPGNLASWAYLRPMAPAVRALINTPDGIQKALDQGITPQMMSAIMTGTAASEQ